AFLAYRSGLIFWRGQASRAETGFLLGATALPVAMSILFGTLSLVILEATCKVCIGIYAASAICLVGALLAHRETQATLPWTSPWGRFPSGLVEGALFVAILTAAYVLLAPRPDPEKSLTGCGWLVQSEDPAEVMVPLESGLAGTPSIELLDPLCPSCKAFDARLSASSLRSRLALKAVLFPLDSTCNWMVTEAVHPGACAVSEAVLCAAGLEGGTKNAAAVRAVLRWAFENQDELRTMAAKDESALRARLVQQFPAVKGCLGGPRVKSKLTKGLRWAVANAVPVLTPQLFVAESRMCDEDTDLGLEYTLSRMLSPAAEQDRIRRRVHTPPPPSRPVRSEPLAAAQAAPSEPADPPTPDALTPTPVRGGIPSEPPGDPEPTSAADTPPAPKKVKPAEPSAGAAEQSAGPPSEPAPAADAPAAQPSSKEEPQP
ncbi:MAG TPA: hypothetical protein VE782_02050, partial [Myxococcaceae bacterium]|nr:hypothetical protein [Myxococcaceae bacterium]